MIIKELDIINFGKFSHQHVDFDKGMNIVYGENEAGKTTIHTFIRGMLFGIEKQRGKASSKDVYSKYEPWSDPTNYQGKMRIEQNGVNYRIERIFHKNNKLFKVIDEDRGVELTRDEIDVLLAGIDEKCYYNTISISQLGSVTDNELELILKNYAANLGATKAMEIDIKGAFEDLDKQRKKISVDSSLGQEAEVERSLSNLTSKLEQSEIEKKNIVDSLESKQAALDEVRLKYMDLKIKDDKRMELIAKQNERKDKLYQDALVYTADVQKYASSLEQINARKEELEQKLHDYKVDDRASLDNLVERVTRKSNVPIVFLILMLSCIGLGAGIIAGSGGFGIVDLMNKALLGCIAGTAVFGVASIIKYVYNKKRKARKLEQVKEIKKILEEQETAKHEGVYMERQLANKQDALEKTQMMLRAENENTEGSEDYSGELKEVGDRERDLKDQINKAQWLLEQKQEKDIDTNNQIEHLREVQDDIRRAKEEIEAIDIAKREISDIATEIRNSFGKRLNERASYYMARITNGKYDNLTIDEKLNISVNAKHSLINASRLSKGTVEQIYMSLRLAAADLLFEGNSMPILLDDAFAMYDNKRMGNTMRYMGQEMDQVILFSCHTREKVMADKIGIDYKLIRL